VELSVEQANFAKAGSNYQTTVMFIEQKISGIRKALRGE
jgi:flagellar basal body rod protein FlgB